MFVHYCDGSSFASARDSGVTPSTTCAHNDNATCTDKLYFRGRANLEAITADLLENQGMDSASQVILTGGSAGGLAVYLVIDLFASWLDSSVSVSWRCIMYVVFELVLMQVRVVGFPDAGFMLDHTDVTGALSYRQNFIKADPLWNTTASGSTNSDCLRQYETAAWKCLFAQYVTPSIQVR